jgi:Tfp pilus assembly ATPase PilU
MMAFEKLTPLVGKIIPEGMVKKIAYQIKDFKKSPEMNLAIADPDISRFRVKSLNKEAR